MEKARESQLKDDEVKTLINELGLTDEFIINEDPFEKFKKEVQEKCKERFGGGDDTEGGDEGTTKSSDEEVPVGEDEQMPVPEVEDDGRDIEPAPVVSETPPPVEDEPEPKTVSYPFEKIRYTDKSAFERNQDNWVEGRLMMLRKRGIIP